MIRVLFEEGTRYHSLDADAGVPQRLSEDDEYQGLFFEKGTVVHANIA